MEKNRGKPLAKALTIAGSDSSGGAGIEADIKTMTAHGVYALCAITAITAQNSMGITGLMEVSPLILRQQLEAVFSDIFPDAVKIGMVYSAPLIQVVGEALKTYSARKVVIDPLMASSTGTPLLSKEAMASLEKDLLPLAHLITPNLPEAEILSQKKIQTDADREEAGKILFDRFGASVLIKGGHQQGQVSDHLAASDLLYDGKEFTWFEGKRIDNPNTHGTGCTLSSAIASNLAKGKALLESIREAKNFLSMAMASMLDLGEGSGPLDHLFAIEGNFPVIR